MNTRFSRCGYLFVFVAVLATGCGSSNPAGPSGASAPQPLTPANNSQVQYGSQPVTLTVQNAVSTTGGATYTFEVATDGNFTNKVQTKDSVAEGSDGQTSVKLDMLDAQKDYSGTPRLPSPARAAPLARCRSLRSASASSSTLQYRLLRSRVRRPGLGRLCV